MNNEAQRDSYRVDLKCPNCELQGVASVSEEDYPFTENRRFSVDDVTAGFSVQNAGSIVSEMEIVCSECNVSARPPSSSKAETFRMPHADEDTLHSKTLGFFRRP